MRLRFMRYFKAYPALARIVRPSRSQPRVFEPDLCKALIAYYKAGGARDSGFMRSVNGKTVGMYDYSHKRRADKVIDDVQLRNACMARVHRRIVPSIRQAFHYEVTRIERHIVACYDAELGGHFRPHRDDTTPATAHRKFAVSLMLNTGDYDGGELRFPEFGRTTYTAPPGGAVVFSGALLHEATPVKRGQRFAYLPFLYDEAAAAVRRQAEATIDSPAPRDELGNPLTEVHHPA
jgi:predicted 2-oxoglutarate/Fe(II)-dependent dioxygenase YbiX